MASLVRTPFILRQYKPEDLHSPALRVPKHEPATRIQYSSAPPDIRTISESLSEVSSGQTSNELPQGGVPYTAANNTASPDKARRAWFTIPFVARKTRKHASKAALEIHHQVSPDHHTNANPSPPNIAVITSSATEAIRPSLASSADPAEQPIQEIQGQIVTVPRSSPSIYLLAKRVYVGRLRDIELPSMLEEEWQINVRDRLINDLRPVVEKILPHVSRHGAIIEPILCMTGEEDPGSANVQLRPTIWIKCGSRRCKNAIRQEVQHLAYLQAFSKGRVQVHLGAPIYASYSHAGSGSGNPFMQLPEGFGRLVMLFPDRSSHSSACGIQLKHISDLPGNVETTRVIGGAISVDNMVYGLTTAHFFFATHCQDFSESESVITDEDSELDMTANPAPTPASRTAAPATQGRWRTAVLSNFSYAGKTLPNVPEGFPRPSTGSDFALIRLDMSTHALPNLYRTLSSDSSNSLRHQLDGYSFDLTPGDVLVVCSPDDVRPGHLLKGPAMFVDGTTCFRTRKIETNSPLEPGVSGSWVVRGSTLLGMIVATYLQESYAHMLPVGDVFSDIEKLLTKNGRKPRVDIFNPASNVRRGDYIDEVQMDEITIAPSEKLGDGLNTHSKNEDKQVDTRTIRKKEKTNIDLEKGEQGRVSTTHSDDRTKVASEAPADEAETNSDPNIVDWDGPDDPENPQNWTQVRKRAFLLALTAVTWITCVGSYLLIPAIPEVIHQFRESSTLLAPFVVSVYILGFALGPLIMTPLSEFYGRVRVYNISSVFFIIFTIACSVSLNFRMLIGFRFLEGCAGAATLTIGAGSIADIFPIDKRGKAMAFWSLGTFLGPILGPVAAGFIVEAKDWRWVFWIFAMFAGFFTLLFLVLSRETYAPILLERKAARLRKELGNPNLRSRTALDTPLKEIFGSPTKRAIKMLSKNPIIFLMSLYLAVNYGIFHVIFTTVVFVFQDQYHFSPSSVGLSCIGAGIGMILGIFFSSNISTKVIRRHRAYGNFKPEHRLPTVAILLGGIGLPIGLFLYGWAAHYKLHYMASITGIAFVGFSSMTGMVTVQMYLVDAFTIYAASALAAVVVPRSILGALLPLAGLSMYNTLGLGWGNSVLGFISLAFVPIPIVIRCYGERIRMNSRFRV